MKGHKNEKEVWQTQRKNLTGKWDRYELMTPAGHPDVKGSYLLQIYYIENKVSDKPSIRDLEESQKDYIKWLLECGQRVYMCFGNSVDKSLRFHHLDPNDLVGGLRDPSVPPFWRGGRSYIIDGGYVCTPQYGTG